MSRAIGGRAATSVALASALVVVLVAAAVVSQALPRGDRNAETPAVSAPSTDAALVSELEAAAQTADATIVTLRSELQAARDQGVLASGSLLQLEERVAQSEREVAGVREELTRATGQLDQSQQLIATQRQQLAALKECLAGHFVAIELGRQESWNAANRAIATVGDACTQSRQVP